MTGKLQRKLTQSPVGRDFTACGSSCEPIRPRRRSAVHAPEFTTQEDAERVRYVKSFFESEPAGVRV